jgi:aarF domain-containing kinase
MDFIDDAYKISEVEKLKEMFPETYEEIPKIMIKSFAKMLFESGHIHCDPHPGNLLIRRNPKSPMHPQLVLLDHGFYCTLDKKFLDQWNELWSCLVTFNYPRLKEIAFEMGIGEYYRYLPLFFTFRTINSTKRIGQPGMTEEEKKFLKHNDEGNNEKLNHLLELLPTEIYFIVKSTQ